MFEKFFSNLFGDVLFQNSTVRGILLEASNILKDFDKRLDLYLNDDI